MSDVSAKSCVGHFWFSYNACMPPPPPFVNCRLFRRRVHDLVQPGAGGAHASGHAAVPAHPAGQSAAPRRRRQQRGGHSATAQTAALSKPARASAAAKAAGCRRPATAAVQAAITKATEHTPAQLAPKSERRVALQRLVCPLNSFCPLPIFFTVPLKTFASCLPCPRGPCGSSSSSLFQSAPPLRHQPAA